ncbi:ScbA/BarX family gamma-butyrolactone biosynthesis protein [Kitasatospora sp. NPDC056731]|uniref:ScbA/BarX family gamma-butyrolactone biosynthesis protein n=1 Tax=Kitasatospora sp. NPDC056731 TaxID=3155422 RepID=UPI00341FD469
MKMLDFLPSSAARHPARPLSWSRTVPRELVHRAAVAEVLLTDVRARGGDRFEAAAQWPRSHPTFPRGRGERHDPLIAVETARQLGIYLPLRHYGVPADTHLLITDVSCRVDPAAEPRGDGPAAVLCRAQVHGLRTSAENHRPTGMRLRVDCSARGVVFARIEGGTRFVERPAYPALRGTALAGDPADSGPPPDPPSPAEVGVALPSDVLVTRAGSGSRASDGSRADDALLICPADPAHPFFFDHSSDHMPGMVLLEAARQAAALRSAGRLSHPVDYRMKAVRFTEFAPLPEVDITEYEHLCVFHIRQNGHITAVGSLGY